MMRSLYSAVSGLRNHQTAMDVIGNNIANVNTVGFKSSRVLFQDIFSQSLGSATAATFNSASGTGTGGTNAKQVGLGMTISSITNSISQGSAQTTDYTLDLMINGNGYFACLSADGTIYYTRDGAFDIDSQGYLVNKQGDYVLGVMNSDDEYEPDWEGTDVLSTTGAELERIHIDTAYTFYGIDKNGVVQGQDDDGSTVYLGRIGIATFVNPAGLTKEGNNYLQQSANSGTVEYYFANDGKAGSVSSNALEMSNVDLANEMTSMIVTQRGFQANSRVITVSDSMLEELINLKR